MSNSDLRTSKVEGEVTVIEHFDVSSPLTFEEGQRHKNTIWQKSITIDIIPVG